MSIAIWLVYEKTKVSEPSFSKKIIKIYFYHLVINLTWSFIFFYYHLIFAAFINIIFLIIAISILMVLYTEEQLLQAYSEYIAKLKTIDSGMIKVRLILSLEEFRKMYESEYEEQLFDEMENKIDKDRKGGS